MKIVLNYENNLDKGLNLLLADIGTIQKDTE